MGGIGSTCWKKGYKKKLTVERAKKIKTEGYCQVLLMWSTNFGLVTRKWVACPQCGQPRKDLFKVKNGVGCRKCLNLTYKSSQTRKCRNIPKEEERWIKKGTKLLRKAQQFLAESRRV